jgi:hypothetical protein
MLSGRAPTASARHVAPAASGARSAPVDLTIADIVNDKKPATMEKHM